MCWFHSVFKIWLLACLLLLAACGGVTVLGRKQARDIYSPEFSRQVRTVKKLYGLGQWDGAFKQLQKLGRGPLPAPEQAMYNNLLGVMYFSQERYRVAIKHFQTALKTSEQDLGLTAQIQLNLASSYYKLQQFIRAYSTLKATESRWLVGLEKGKYFRLFFVLAQELGDNDDALRGLVSFLGTHQTIAQIKGDRYFSLLIHNFEQLERSAKVRLLEEYTEQQNLAAGYLGFLLAENSLYQGERELALEMLEWVQDHFDQHSRLQLMLTDLEDTIEGLSKIAANSIGIVLPFSGRRKKFARRAMLGIDFAVRKLRKKYRDIKIHMTDGQGDALVGRRRVRELIEQHSVSLIIGGLFSDGAKEEYLEARKHGVMFISLAPVFLPRKEKGFLLLEVPGSVESQVKRVLSPKVIDKLGKRVAVVYPNSLRGKAYIDELWLQSLGSDVQVVAVQSYLKGTKDFRMPVAKILGLQHLRTRQEELDFMQSIHALQKSNIRRVQTLSPLVNFDWVYSPVYPQDAIQIIPSFAYYDAGRVSFVGSPSWRSKTLHQVGSGRIYFIGDGIDQVAEKVLNDFVGQYQVRPRLIEINALESVYLASQFIFDGNSDRASYNAEIRAVGKLQGLTGKFQLIEGLWVKEMHSFRIKKKKIYRADF